MNETIGCPICMTVGFAGRMVARLARTMWGCLPPRWRRAG